MDSVKHTPHVIAQFLPLSVRGISINDGSISFGSEKQRVVIGQITNACSFGDFVLAACKGRRDFGAPDTAATQMSIADEIVRRTNVHDDLLDALKGLYETGAPDGLALTADELQGRFEAARAAIAKATGGQ